MFDEVVGSALGQLSRVLKDRNVELALPPTLPLLSFDAVLIERLLCNLLDNAIKYSSPASLIRIAAVPMGQDVRVSVEDRSEEHTSELQSLMRISYAVFCLKKK